MKTSVVVVTYNSEKTISDCLNSFKSSLSDGTEIIDVDNSSTDTTVEEVKKFKNVKLIQNKDNLGFGKANNLAAKDSKGKYLFLLNPDCVIVENVIEELSDYLERHIEVGVVGPKLVNQQGKVQREMSPFPDFWSQVLILLKLHRFSFFQNLVYPNYNYEQEQEAQHLMGAALMVRKDVFDEVGGFDEQFFLWFEETDLLKRISERGRKIVYLPGVSVTHIGGQSIGKLNFIKKQNNWNKSLLYYFYKHKSLIKLAALLPFVVLSYPLALLSTIVKRAL